MTAPIELLLHEGLTASGASGLLAGHLSLLSNQAKTIERIFWDSDDGLLRAAGLTLIDMGARLMLADAGTLAQRAASNHKRGAQRLRAGDIAEGELRDALTELLGETSIAPVARVQSRLLPLNILGGYGKTVVRLLVEEASLIRADDSTTPLRARLRVTLVPGCEENLAEVLAVLEGELGLPVAPGPLLDDALAAAGRAA